jgi:hypothetical protein
MNKGFKISFWILCGLACVLIASMCLIGLFSYFTHNFKKTQDGYFAKVEYSIEGYITDKQIVGGPYCLIELEPTKFEIMKNEIHSSDDYVGVFASDTSKVFIIAPLPENFSSSSLDRIEINTHNRQCVFNDTSVSTLRTASLYKHKLPNSNGYIPF